jgi:hypothetical protein
MKGCPSDVRDIVVVVVRDPRDQKVGVRVVHFQHELQEICYLTGLLRKVGVVAQEEEAHHVHIPTVYGDR